MEFSHYPKSDRYYGGTERKIGILIDSVPHMVKFQKMTAFGCRYNHISEHIGSRIFSKLGILTQETLMGTYEGRPVVICRDFVGEGEQFVPFNDVGESTLDQNRERYQYEYDDIMGMLRTNSKLTSVEESIALFWEIYIVDALLGNFDRHGANWGFIKRDNTYRLAPVFDNGSCLFPSLDEGQMRFIMESQDETDARVYKFPTSQIRLDGRKSSYFDVIDSLAFPECNKALAAIMSRTTFEDILGVLDDVRDLSDVRRAFYEHMLENRFRKILQVPYEHLMGGRQ